MKTEPTMIIIGAGIAGLSTGIYARMNGFDTQIYEMGSLPGGLCTSWSRKGYTFDGCIQWLVGTNPASSSHVPWQEVRALEGKTIYDPEEYQRVEVDGQCLIVYTDVDRFEKAMIDLAPEDLKPVKELTAGIRSLASMDLPLDTPGDPLAGVKSATSFLPAAPVWFKWGKVTMKDFVARLKSPFLRRALPLVAGEDFPIVGLMFMLSWMTNRNAGYPIGGSLEFAKTIEQRYLALGGKIEYHARVEKILVENDTAAGIRLSDGSEHRAAWVVSAADGHATIFDMLDGKYLNDTIRGYYDTFPIFQPIVQVSLGINRDMSHAPASVSFPLEQPINVSGTERTRLGYKIYHFDPTLAPAGKTVLQVLFDSNYAYWKAIAGDTERYESEKKAIAVQVIDRLEKRFPGIAGQIEVVDVATPLTTERYTGNWQGSIEGWMVTEKTMKMAFGKGMDKTLPGLKHFYMVGQWVEPGGGLPTAVMSGRKLVKQLCQKARKPFITTTQ